VLVTRNLLINREDSGRGRNIRCPGVELQLLDSKGDLGVSTQPHDLFPVGTLFINLKAPYLEGDDVWVPDRYPALGNALSAVRHVEIKTLGQLDAKGKDMPKTEQDKLYQRANRAKEIGYILESLEGNCLKAASSMLQPGLTLDEENALIIQLRELAVARPFRAWFLSAAKLMERGHAERWKTLAKAVLARQRFEFLRRVASEGSYKLERYALPGLVDLFKEHHLADFQAVNREHTEPILFRIDQARYSFTACMTTRAKADMNEAARLMDELGHWSLANT
jgi:hypothetical protein